MCSTARNVDLFVQLRNQILCNYAVSSVHRCVRLKLYQHDDPTLTQIVGDMDDSLFETLGE